MNVFHQLLVLLLTMSLHGLVGDERRIFCQTPQYVEYGTTATINCQFDKEFQGVYWYNSTNIVKDLPVINLERSLKYGPGLDSGEFDVHQNGSLVINEVTLEHDHAFAVIYVKTTSTPQTAVVAVTVTVKPNISHPVIDKCQDDIKTCFAEMYEGSELTCSVSNARPKVSLHWMTRTANGDFNVSSDTAVSIGSLAFTSETTISRIFNQSKILVLVFCKALDVGDILENEESVILVQNGNINLSNVEPTAMQVLYNSKFELFCVERKVPSIVWKRVMPDGSLDTVAVSFANGKQIGKEHKDSFFIGQKNSLLISNVRLDHEGVYACIYSGEGLEGMSAFSVSVAVLPEPRYPLVDGCDGQYCSKKTGLEGSLTCRVNGIRPKISLKWKTRYSESLSKITFSNHRMTYTAFRENNTFDVSLTSDFTIIDASERRLTIECVVDEMEFEKFKTSTIVDLLIQYDEGVFPTEDTLGKPEGFRSWMVVLILPFMLAVCVAAYFALRKRRQLRQPYASEVYSEGGVKYDSEQEESEPLRYEIAELGIYESADYDDTGKVRKSLEAPDLDDLCQVPAQFLKLMKITGHHDTSPKFNTVTAMFRYVISRFFDRKRIEVSGQDLLTDTKHHELDKLAFSGLLMANRGDEMMWEKEKACQEIGEELYQECVELGFLCESEGQYNNKLEVRFYDKLLCHWYAAHYFSYRVSRYGGKDATEHLNVDPCEHHYFYRFSCGLHQAASEEVKKYLTHLPDGSGDRLAILCDLEETGNLDNIKQTLKELFKDLKYVEIRQEDKKLFQMSTLKLCEIAYSLEISVPPLWMIECFDDVNIQNGDLKLENGLTVKLKLFNEVRIEEAKEELTETKVCQILELAARSGTLEKIGFWHCLVTKSLQQNKDLLASLQKGQLKVQWLSKSGEIYDLNFETGNWKMFGRKEVTDEKYAEEVNVFRATGHYTQ